MWNRISNASYKYKDIASEQCYKEKKHGIMIEHKLGTLPNHWVNEAFTDKIIIKTRSKRWVSRSWLHEKAGRENSKQKENHVKFPVVEIGLEDTTFWKRIHLGEWRICKSFKLQSREPCKISSTYLS